VVVYDEVERKMAKGFKEKVEVIVSLGGEVIGFNYVRVYGKQGSQV
jgi:hypothetical protein